MAGTVGSAGGITSLVSYPALLAVGLPPLVANVTQSVAFVACGPGSVLGWRAELRGQFARLRQLLPIAAVGTLGGAVLLLVLPGADFSRVVPYLLALGALALLAQPRLTRWRARRRRAGVRRSLLLPAGVAVIAFYDGYFGAGAGILLLALLLVADEEAGVLACNATKNVLLGLTAAVAAVAFAFSGSVRWTLALPLGAGLLLGNTLGPALARRIPAGVLRGAAACAGLGLAAYLWVTGG